MPTMLEVQNTEAAILSRAVRPERGDLSPEAARSLLKVSISDADQKRAQELLLKAQAGSLTNGEEAELNNFRAVGRLLELLKSKARLSLKQAAN